MGLQPDGQGSQTGQERSAMKSAIPCTWAFRRHEASSTVSISDSAETVIVAAVTTLLWAAIIGLVCWAYGVAMRGMWFAGALAVIFAIALLGLNLLKQSPDSPPHDEQH
jgi:hypothetical protein